MLTCRWLCEWSGSQRPERGFRCITWVSSRPSDAIALAVRATVPIYADEAVLEEAGIEIEDEEEDEVERFKEFLDSVSPEDFK
jgi:bifunctional DNase/RNase